jgi:Mce-associated membrane protein
MPSPSSQGPTWYDILGVSPDATPDEVKAAWRAATDKFEPGSGTSQFRLFNEAADVLLDPARRAAYDAELAGADPQPVAPEEATPGVAPVEVPVADDEPSAYAEPAPDVEPARGRLGRVPVALLAGVLGVVVALVVLSVLLADGLHGKVATADARDEASSVAERALTAVLSYDYRHMEADRDRAARFLTPAYRKQYLKNFNDLLNTGPDGTPGPAVKTQAVVKADVLDTGIVDAESDRVRVIVFVNQSSTKGTAEPTIFQDRVVATMVRRGDAWLVDNIKSY